MPRIVSHRNGFWSSNNKSLQTGRDSSQIVGMKWSVLAKYETMDTPNIDRNHSYSRTINCSLRKQSICVKSLPKKMGKIIAWKSNFEIVNSKTKIACEERIQETFECCGTPSSSLFTRTGLHVHPAEDAWFNKEHYSKSDREIERAFVSRFKLFRANFRFVWWTIDMADFDSPPKCIDFGLSAKSLLSHDCEDSCGIRCFQISDQVTILSNATLQDGAWTIFPKRRECVTTQRLSLPQCSVVFGSHPCMKFQLFLYKTNFLGWAYTSEIYSLSGSYPLQ